jgi:hypothetical protein
LIYSTDPRNRDTDGDNLIDYDEVTTHKTNPRLVDTDSDGLPDGLEVFQGTDPLVPNPPTATPPTPATATQPPPATNPPTATPPTPSVTPPPTATASATATSTATGTATQTPTATITTAPPPAIALTCVLAPPVIDGTINVGSEWPGTPLFTFQPAVVGAERIVRVYGVRDATRLYFGYLINDAVNEAADSARLYIDTTNSGGDPDSADRFFQVNRNGDRLIWAGMGDSTDSQMWNTGYVSTNWTSAVGEPGSGQWAVEIQIDATAEIGALTNPFALMAEVFYTGDTAAYPSTAVSTQANTWQDVGNVTCQ